MGAENSSPGTIVIAEKKPQEKPDMTKQIIEEIDSRTAAKTPLPDSDMEQLLRVVDAIFKHMRMIRDTTDKLDMARYKSIIERLAIGEKTEAVATEGYRMRREYYAIRN